MDEVEIKIKVSGAILNSDSIGFDCAERLPRARGTAMAEMADEVPFCSAAALPAAFCTLLDSYTLPI